MAARSISQRSRRDSSASSIDSACSLDRRPTGRRPAGCGRSCPEDIRAKIIDLAGATTLDTLAGVFALASACVSNDSGAMHLAGAVGVPLAALFGPTRERETAPLARRGRRMEVLINHVWCRPCMLRECPLDHRCMRGLSPERVLATLLT